jgi:hypothetical protein
MTALDRVAWILLLIDAAAWLHVAATTQLIA